MSALLLKYNPGVFGDEELMRSFVVRYQHLELILESLRENAASLSANRHLLIVGPRGIGKTTLVRRVAAEVRANPGYGGVWYPIVYGEESYQVGSAGEFWLEALVHLEQSDPAGDWQAGLDELRGERNESRLRERALSQLLDFARRQNKRLLLVVENLHMLCDQISSDAAWEIRHTLLNEPRIMLLSTATSRFDTITHSDQAWFELFAVQELKPLERDDCSTLWQSVTQEEVNPGHIRAIRILTGGSPRLLTVLASFAAKRSFQELMEQLVHLIDDHTEYFKSHLDGLPPKERKVFVALLEKWDPVSAAELAGLTRMGVNEVSSLLNRLVGRGAVELFEQKPRRKLYQATERLYNIYYLMRRRGQPADRVRAAVSFMVRFFRGRKLAATIEDLVREACSLPTGKTEDHYQAFAELERLVPERVWQTALLRTPQEFFEREDTPEPVRYMAGEALQSKAIDAASRLLDEGKWHEGAAAFREATRLYPSILTWVGLGTAHYKLGLQDGEQSNFDQAEQAVRHALELNARSGWVWYALGEILERAKRVDEALNAFRECVNLGPDESQFWFRLGVLLSTTGPAEEAERVWEAALRLHPTLSDYAAYLLRARLRNGHPIQAVLNEAEEWIQRGGRTTDLLLSIGSVVLESKHSSAIAKSEEWTSEAWSKDPSGWTSSALVTVFVVQKKWTSALEVMRPMLDTTHDSGALNDAGLFLIGIAGNGFAREALDLLATTKAAAELEPVVVGLRLYLGESPQVAKEILEIGREVAAHITSLAAAHAANSRPDSNEGP